MRRSRSCREYRSVRTVRAASLSSASRAATATAASINSGRGRPTIQPGIVASHGHESFKEGLFQSARYNGSLAGAEHRDLTLHRQDRHGEHQEQEDADATFAPMA